MDLKALILLAVCLTGLSDATGKVKHPGKKQNDKHNHLQDQQQQISEYQEQLERLNQLIKQNHHAPHTSLTENRTPLGREKFPLPLVLSPDNLHDMDFSPALTVALPPNTSADKGKLPQGHKKTSDLYRRQAHYDAALASLLEDALKTAVTMQPEYRQPSHEVPLQPAPPVYHVTPATEQLSFLHTPESFPVPKQPVIGLTEAFVKPPVVLTKQHFSIKDDGHDELLKNYAAKYKYGYRVVDVHTGNDFGQAESRSGGLTTGHYHVLLPDGRLQTVQYWSDATGFHSHISYDRYGVHV